MTSSGTKGNRAAASDRRAIAILLAAVLSALTSHATAQTGELPATAREVRELRALVQQLPNVTWTVNPKLTFAAEGDYAINRVFSQSAPVQVDGGALYARYQLTPTAALAGRCEYLSDRGGLFRGTTQALKETTLTYEYKLAEGFLMRTEWGRDFSNHPLFLTATPGALKKEQNTATLA